jgi:hypothetical protein
MASAEVEPAKDAPAVDMNHFKQHLIYKIHRKLIQPRYFVLKRRILNEL